MSTARVRLRRRRDRHRFSVACKSCNGVRSIGDAKRLVEMLVDGHAASDEVTAQRRGPDLQDPPVELHGVRIRDRPLMLNGKDPLEARRRGDERGPRLSGRDRKPAVEGGDAVGLEPGVGRANFLDPDRRQSVSADLAALSGILAAYVDLPGLGCVRSARSPSAPKESPGRCRITASRKNPPT